MTPRTIPESEIAINPIIINDTHRQSREHRCPIDEHALVERLKEWALKYHNDFCGHCTRQPICTDVLFNVCKSSREERTLIRVIDLIQNGRVRQQHRMLVPKGWMEVDSSV